MTRTGSRIGLLAAVALSAFPVNASAKADTAKARPIADEVRDIEDADSVKILQRAYGYYIDRGYWDEAADLFADNATFEWGQDGVYVGKQRIREYLIRSTGGNVGPGLPYGQLNHRMQLQPVVTVSDDGTTAKARWRELALIGQFKVSAEWGQGVYENTYVKEGGVWKIASLHFFPDFVAPYEGGWAKLAKAPADWRTQTAKDFPPDRPPTVEYRPFPELYTPTFHYSASDIGKPPAPVAGKGEEADRVAILRSRREIEELQSALGYFIDKGMWKEAAALFAPDGTYEFGQRGVYVGRKRVEQALALAGPQGLEPGQLNIYMMLQPIIDVSADNRTAQGRWRSDVNLAKDGKGYWGEGTYENTYVKIDGVWKIKSFNYHPTFLADYDKGWGEGALPLEGPSTQLPPDRPPTSTYQSFPSTYVVPFHYVHPVAGAKGAPDWTPTNDAAVADLRKRIGLLEDRDAIEKVQRAYGYYVDKSLWGDVANLFAEDGKVEIGGRGIFVTRPNILRYMRSLGEDGPKPGLLMNHQQFQGITTVAPDGKTAEGRWAAFVMAGQAPTADLGVVAYENRYVKVDGVWQIASLHAPFLMYTHYKDGWAKHASPITRPDSWLPPPDYAPSVLTNNYPSFYVAPYHYPNPVTGKPMPPQNPAAGGVAPMRMPGLEDQP